MFSRITTQLKTVVNKKIVWWIVLLMCLIVSLADVVLYPGFIKNYTSIQPGILFIFAAVAAVFARRTTVQLGTILLTEATLFIGLPMLTLLSLSARAAEILLHSNFVYTHFHLDPTQLSFYTIGCILATLPLLTRDLMQKYGSKLTFIYSFHLYNILLLYWLDVELFTTLRNEDGVVEYTTFALFVLSAVSVLRCIPYIKQLSLKKWQQTMSIAVLIIIAVGLLVIAGEEISWGQRLFGIDTPEHIAQQNTQGELNFHNNHAVFGMVYKAYLVANLYGLLSWLVYKLISPRLSIFYRTTLRLVTSRWFLIPLFIPNAVYVLLRLYHGNALIDQWEEYTEVFQAAGIFAIWWLNVQYLRSRAEK